MTYKFGTMLKVDYSYIKSIIFQRVIRVRIDISVAVRRPAAKATT